ncbi:MAG: fumarylacetoacetate hydrolase family protein [Calditrichaeota bacterium]|nr:fumarylacetoacetate hydrolase family protein [Calditrichota bacterium]
MKFLILLLSIFGLAATYAVAEDMVYCRFSYKESVHYGRVKGKKIYVLDKAPWSGGQETGQVVPLNKVRLLHPSEPRVILGLGGSYQEAWKDNGTPYKTVRWFTKPPTAAASPGDDIVLPASLDEIKVEVELVIVIGKTVKDADEAEAQQAIFGYTVGDDVVGSVDSYHRIQGEPQDQKEGLLPPGLKIGDHFAPFGPFIHRGIDWRNLERTLRITNPETDKNVLYKHNTSHLVYSPAKIVSDLSKVLTLSPGDIIFTGTTQSFPAVDGDVVQVSIKGVGECVNRVVAPTKK